MYCNQCEQAVGGEACVTVGVCGKDEDVKSMQMILSSGLQGLASYAHHARRLGKLSTEIDAYIQAALAATHVQTNYSIESLLELALECGRLNLEAMEMIDQGHIEHFGQPRPTRVACGSKKGPGILVTGHDLVDLDELLRQTAGTGINVYTHGEMLPAHSFPKFQDYPHLAGQFGGSWRRQREEFEKFSGPIVGTSDCVLNPSEAYQQRMFTTGICAVAGGTQLKDADFSPVIRSALDSAPLPDEKLGELETGFHHNVIAELLGDVVDAVKAGEIKQFHLIAGCDGKDGSRDLYTTYAQNLPPDAVILTLGCLKYRLHGHDFGTVANIPRLLDMGQCNDAHGAVRLAAALAKEFECGLNDLPLSIELAWTAQRGITVLLSLLHLGVKGIHVGPSSPAFVTPNILSVLEDRYDLKINHLKKRSVG